MRSTYQKLFSITVNHDYFSDAVCKSIDILPTAECKSLLSSYNLIYKTKEGVITLLYDADNISIKELQESDKLKLSFYFKINDSYFINYTSSFDLPRDHTWYFNNEQNAKYLHQMKTGVPQYDKIAVKKPVFTYFNDTPVTTLFIKSGSGDSVFSFIQENGKPSVQNIEIDLRDFPEDTYKLYVNKPDNTETQEDFTFLTATTFQAASGTRCYADIFLRKAYTFPADYEVVFLSKEVFCKYYFIERSIKNLDEDALISVEPKDISKPINGTGITFKNTGKEALPNGAEAICYESSSPIQIKEKSDLRLKLKSKSLREPLILPMPTYKALKRMNSIENGSSYYSEHFIYL